MLNSHEKKSREITLLKSNQSIFGPDKAIKIVSSKSQLSDGARIYKSPNERRGVIHQLLVTGAVLILTAACGMPIGYSAVLLPQLSGNTTDPLRLDVTMGSWIASIHSAATPVGSFASGPIMDILGRKTALLISILPLVGGWTCIALAQSHLLLLIGRVVCGVAVGLISAPVQVYIAEIAEPRLRGVLIGAPFVAYSVGILFIYGLGAALHWRAVAWCAIILPTISFLAVIFAPETPTWLIRHNLTAKASAALSFLRGDDEKGKRELQQLTMRYEREKALMTASSERFVNILKRKSVMKPLIIINTFNMIQVISGVYLVIFYAVDIIKEFGGDTLTPTMAAVFTAVVRLISTIIYCFLLMYTSRRMMSILSGLGTGIAATSLAIIFYVHPENMGGGLRVLCAVFLVIYIGCSTGYMVLPGIMVGELLPARIRGQVAGYIFCLFNLGLFILAKGYPYVKDDMKTSGLFLMFGVSSLVGVILLYIVFPETKGKTLGAIEDYFMENPWMWSRRKSAVNRRDMTRS
ncbi:facilitated trehalose transporter Tret1-2 homolog isoform X2 [Phlebotomus argentipes]|nr:facilitated trehalose transporter Tret1-2 homolog isoform X2 [Phlebotomus argentipes]